MATMDLIATTAFGLEAVVKRELEALGYEGKAISPGWLRFQGDLAAICRTNLWLRTADRVLVRMASFEAQDFDALFETTKSLAWNEWLGKDAAFPVIGRSLKSQLSSVPACQRAVKKAVVESLMAAHGTTELPETGPQYKIEIALLKDQATLTIDTTGPSLHKRGYRTHAGKAPLKETLAAAMIQLSFWDRERPLSDPFCGSGTIPIEAAMFGRNIAPGLNREFSAEDWPNIPEELWNEARSEARDLIEAELEERLIGTDIDERVLRAARENAERAGVADAIHFQEKPFESLTSKRRYGCVITNPPYGERLGEQHELESLYHSIPEVLRRLPTWSHFILTAYPDFESRIQRTADRRRKLYNGRIECTYFQFHGPRPGDWRSAQVPRSRSAQVSDLADSATEGLPAAGDPTVEPSAGSETLAQQAGCAAPETLAQPCTTTTPKTARPRVAPVFGGITNKGHEQAELFRSRLKKRARHLRRWPTRQGITCFRVYERDIPEIPLIVDRYEDHLHITEYERPHDRDIAQHADWLDLMVRTAGETLEVDHRKIFFKRRERQRGMQQHEHLADQRYETMVNEGGLKFLVNLSDYVDTGLFLDHRLTRSMVRDLAKDANFLNLFGYTGAFSVYAASGGAVQTTTIDLSSNYLEWAQRNMSINGFHGEQHQFIRSDGREFFETIPAVETYDLAIVDPPTFSNSKRTEDDWNIQHHYDELLNRLLLRMKPNGVIFFSTNFRRFKFDESLVRATQIHEISRQTVPEDFRNKRIHRCWRIVKQPSRSA
ncbi:MAG: bifunctional 23S rRNA (guanine(2069)-N(7))-methyltransferase RlmK/23S rRNA (guanine(2445)-N(2))-methyltransferase RlmL [Planctomycetaceae bacterium]|nr:bifunctional 23S rRNA (guanine(2069)-N(7))-methyltransferase RlmK/23S rRNA (guanine(2445)-N(2))-methyltransferase RlmL [Planctomycetaceae bacterium]